MGKILIYTFNVPHQLTYKLVDSFDMNVSKYFIGSLSSLEKMLSNNKYDYVIGLGDYRTDARKIRIEKTFINKYGKHKIIHDGQDTHEPNWQLNEKLKAHFSDKPTNGPCNRSAYLLANLIKTEKQKTKLAFIHIPKSFPLVEAKEMLSDWIDSANKVPNSISIA